MFRFIDHNHVRRIVEKYLPQTTVDAMKEQTKADTGDEPPAKKAKLKGRNLNKKRPREKRPEASERPCPAILRGEECRFGERCKFLHDLQKYMESKPADLGEACHLFRTYGYCHYGLSCRYAKDHCSEDLKNKTNEELHKKYQNVHTVSNVLGKDLQRKLWKRQYNFKKAEKTYQRVKAELTAQRNQEKNVEISSKSGAENGGSDKVDGAQVVESKPDLPPGDGTSSAESKVPTGELGTSNAVPENTPGNFNLLNKIFIRIVSSF